MIMKIGTIASHSALNILSGAKKEGFNTVLFLTDQSRLSFYSSFRIADEIVCLNDYHELFEKTDNNTIIIPHGSFVAYLSVDELVSSDLKLFGNKKLLVWESDRQKKGQLMKESNFHIPYETNNIDEAKFPCIVKYDGAEGGKGYFLAQSRSDIEKNLDKSKRAIFQEWISGVKVYVTFFNSVVHNSLELFGSDIRYESDVDGKIRFDNDYAFQIVGNIPVVLRESLLPRYYEMGLNCINTISKHLKTPMVGPFCLETIVTRDLDIVCFEFSGRIVAGTNVYVPYSPYSYITFREEMWMGRRIAREIKEAIDKNKLERLFV